MNTSAAIIQLPQPSTYGAVEIKEFIKKHTWMALIITLSLLVLLLLFYWIYGLATMKTLGAIPRAPISRIQIDAPLQETQEEQTQEIIPPDTKIEYATEARAGIPVPVPDADIRETLKEFASFEKVNESLASNEKPNIDPSQIQNLEIKDPVKNIQKEEDPGMNDFIPVEKQPDVDLAELQKRVVYPDMAKRSGIEGTVILSVLVNKDGKPKKVVVRESASELLNQAAKEAVMKTIFTPAIQNKTPVICWVTIPIRFKLR